MTEEYTPHKLDLETALAVLETFIDEHESYSYEDSYENENGDTVYDSYTECNFCEDPWPCAPAQDVEDLKYTLRELYNEEASTASEFEAKYEALLRDVQAIQPHLNNYQLLRNAANAVISTARLCSDPNLVNASGATQWHASLTSTIEALQLVMLHISATN